MAGMQRGITLISFILVLIVIAMFAILAMNLVPVYSEAFSVRTALIGVADQAGSNSMDLAQLQKKLQKRFDIDYVESVLAKQATIVRDQGGNRLSLVYEVRKPLVYNLDFVAKFDYSAPLNTAAAGGP